MSYFYPDDMSAAQVGAMTEVTAAYMAKAGLRLLNVMSDGNKLSTEVATSYLSQDNIDALFYYPYSGKYRPALTWRDDFLCIYPAHCVGPNRCSTTTDYSGAHGSIEWASGKPVVGGRFSLWGDGTQGPDFKSVPQAAAALLAAARTPTTAAGYSLIPLHAWSHNVSDALRVMQLVAAGGGGVDFVTCVHRLNFLDSYHRVVT